MGETDSVKRPETAQAHEHFDVLIIGAGISGVGSAYHLQEQCPDKSYVLLDKFDGFGGTWKWHTFPGVRSDSDLYTFGYRFKPWTSAPIATAEEILNYMGEVIEENGIDKKIRYGHTITKASWSSAENQWTVEARLNATNEVRHFTANFLWMCQGYYHFENGYTPEWEGVADFKGQIIHPQTWPKDTDLEGKNVVVIGSGSTAATVVPAIANDCAHVTLLQRSPTFFLPSHNANELADQLRALEIDEGWIHTIVRKQILGDFAELSRRGMEEPEALKAELLELAKTYLPEGYDIATHFTPSYRPWQQRIAFIPDGDLYRGIASGKVSVVTDHIERFTDNGILLKSGATLEADIIITATGFNLSVMGDIPFEKDGVPVDFGDTVSYRGMMFSGIPNLLWVFGYFRASWTLRVDLLGDFVCRLLKHMDASGVKSVTPALRPEEEDAPKLDWIDADNFNPGYLVRDMAKLPKRLSGEIWQHTQDYWKEKDEIPAIDLDGSEFVYR